MRKSTFAAIQQPLKYFWSRIQNLKVDLFDILCNAVWASSTDDLPQVLNANWNWISTQLPLKLIDWLINRTLANKSYILKALLVTKWEVLALAEVLIAYPRETGSLRYFWCHKEFENVRSDILDVCICLTCMHAKESVKCIEQNSKRVRDIG